MKPVAKASSHRHDRPVSFASSPLLASKTPLWRSKLILISFGLAFVGLAARAAYVQVIHKDFYQRQGEIRFARTLDIPATRGRLLDRSGQVLATNVPAFSVWAVPEDVNESLKAHPEKLDELARLLNLRPADVKAKLAQEDRSFVWLRRQLDGSAQAGIQALQLDGLHVRTESRRQYPDGEAVASLLGSVNVDGEASCKRVNQKTICDGSGMELALNSDLSGKDGSRRVLKDRMGRMVEDVGDLVPPTNGRDVQLTIDNKIQFFAYQKLKEAVIENKAKGGSVVILDVQNNSVLAMVNYSTGKGDPNRNRAVADSFEPGSVMKPLTIALALESGIVKPSTTFQTAPGYITVTGAKITDSHAHGVLTVEQIIQKSSNVGTVKIAQLIPYADMWNFYSSVGLGQKPALPFPGVVSGKLRAYKSWRPMEQATMSYGYGLSVSLYQLAQAYTVLANDGEIITPRLTQSDEPAAKQRLISATNARVVRRMLNLATGPEGTAPKAQVEGYAVGGKTGTANKQEGRGYAAHKYRSTFVGMAPIDAPRIIVAVSIDEPSNGKYFGGDVAAPIFSQTVGATLRLMGVTPDLSIKPKIAVNTTQESI
jgi:cell division protein FtsI (penicillin-binding protein 3)